VITFRAVTNDARSRRFLPALNIVVLGATYLALVARPGRFSTAYQVGLGVGAVVLVLAVLALFGRNPLARWAGRPPFARPLVRAFFAVTPWIGLYATMVATGFWWSQRPWALRLFSTYALATWSLIWYIAPSRDGRAGAAGRESQPEVPGDRTVRTLLVGFAIVLAVLGIDGLAFGVAPFGTAVSALLACGASIVVGVALYAGRATRSNLIAASFGVVLGFACAEAGIRLLHLGENLREVDTGEYVRQFRSITPPRSAFVNWPRTLDEFPPALVEINSIGIRGPEIAPGPVDLLLIGDSMIEARQLPWERTLGPRLQAAFRARSTPARVVSHGMRGWSPLLEWNWYLKVGRRLHPRTVLLFFFWNDLWARGDEVHTFQAVMRPDGRPDHFEVFVDPDWVWYKHVRAVRVAEDMWQRIGLTTIRRTFSMIGGQNVGRDLAGAQALARRMAGDAMLTPGEIDALLTEPVSQLNPRLSSVAWSEFWPSIRPLDLWTESQRQAAAKTEAELQMFSEDVASDGGRLVVVYVPNAYQIAPTECSVARYLNGLPDGRVLPPESGVQTWLRGVAERHHIELLDPSEAMRAFHREQTPGAPPLYLRADCHWSERGHQFMAEYLADWYARSQAAGRN
jgi:hypothetical protein